MIDQLAEGLARFAGVDPNGPLWAERREYFRRMADAALATMKNTPPTALMLAFGENGALSMTRESARQCWSFMIDAARQS